MPIFLSLLVSIFLVGCHSLSGNRAVSQVSASSVYETVNSVPQFADDADHFLFYWAVWRALSKEERSVLSGTEGNLISRRDIKWKMQDCQTDSLLNQNGETVWYLDKLRLDSEGLLIPIKEAPRKDHRYFTLINLNSQHLRGAGPYVAPKKNRGESMSDWDKRRGIARQEWLKKSKAQGTKGTVWILADHRFLLPTMGVDQENWIQPSDYPKLTGDLLNIITRYSPRQWPIHFDERSHKPHLFSEPKIWNRSAEENQILSRRLFRMRLDWNWCEANQPVKIGIFVPKGELPPPGPNRPGRTDSGAKTVSITEIDWVDNSD